MEWWTDQYKHNKLWKGFSRYESVFVPDHVVKPAEVHSFFQHLSDTLDVWNYDDDKQLTFTILQDPEKDAEEIADVRTEVEEKSADMDEITAGVEQGVLSGGADVVDEEDIEGASLKKELGQMSDEEIEDDDDDDDPLNIEEWEFAALALATSPDLLLQCQVTPTIPQLHIKQVSKTNCRAGRIACTFGNCVAISLKGTYLYRIEGIDAAQLHKKFVEMSIEARDRKNIFTLASQITGGFPWLSLPFKKIAEHYLKKTVPIPDKYLNAMKIYDEFMKNFQTLGLHKFNFPDTLEELEQRAEETWCELLDKPEQYLEWVCFSNSFPEIQHFFNLSDKHEQ